MTMPMLRTTTLRLFATALTILGFCANADAGVIVHGTRQIFPGDQREISVRLENIGERASLVQAWTDSGDKHAAPEQSDTPFVLRPPVFRLDGGKSQVLRIVHAGAPLPADRESIFWLNVLDLPPSPQADEKVPRNYLLFNLRTRIKLIYRPKELGDAAGAPQRLTWKLMPDENGWALEASNPTPFYVHFSKLGVRVTGQDHEVLDPGMIEPMSSRRFPLDGLSSHPPAGNVQFEFITDYGGVVAQSVPLAGP